MQTRALLHLVVEIRPSFNRLQSTHVMPLAVGQYLTTCSNKTCRQLPAWDPPHLKRYLKSARHRHMLDLRQDLRDRSKQLLCLARCLRMFLRSQHPHLQKKENVRKISVHPLYCDAIYPIGFTPVEEGSSHACSRQGSRHAAPTHCRSRSAALEKEVA